MAVTHHFAVGSRVVMDNQLYEIFSYNGQLAVLIPVETSGYVKVVRPYYTQWKKQ